MNLKMKMMVNISLTKPKQQLSKNALFKTSSGVDLMLIISNTFQGEHLSQLIAMESSLTIAITLGHAYKLYMAQFNENLPNALTFIGMVQMPDAGMKVLSMHQLTSTITVILM